MAHCSDFEKGKIIALLENGKTIAEVSFETGRSRSTIERWKRRHEEEGEEGMARRPKTGRPRKTTAEQDAAMVEVCECRAKRKPFLPSFPSRFFSF